MPTSARSHIPKTPHAPQDSPLGVIHVGLGPIGQGLAALVAARADLMTVGAMDVDPALIGTRLGDATDDMDASGPAITASLAEIPVRDAAVALHCKGSSLTRVEGQLIELMAAGLNVVSTCEELSYPWTAAPELATRLDQVARTQGVTLIGTGVNPGFAMDHLPVVLMGATQNVDHVRVHRVQDAGQRRLPLQQKVGAGLTPEEFERRRTAGRIRHAGLPQSAHAVAAAARWTLTRLIETIEPVVAQQDVDYSGGTIKQGHVLGLHQRVRGEADGREVINLLLDMAVDIDDPRDEIHLSGTPPLSLVLPGGLPGDTATAAVAVNTIPRAVRAPAGLLTSFDLPPAPLFA